MRIIYTNLKENDAGVKRSITQFRVEFDGTGGRPAADAPSATPALALPDERSDAERLQSTRTPEAADALYQQQITPPDEGMGGFRSIFIKKFVDTQTVVRAGKTGRVSITV
jgi:hypothetical protein